MQYTQKANLQTLYKLKLCKKKKKYICKALDALSKQDFVVKVISAIIIAV